MKPIEEIVEERKKLAEEIKVLRDKDNELYRELRELERSELKHFDGRCIKIGRGLMYVKTQDLNNDVVELKGILINIVDKMKTFYYESSAMTGQGTLSFNIIVDEPVNIPLEEFKTRTTGNNKDIYEIEYKKFEETRDKIAEEFKECTSIFRWINFSQTFRD